MSLPLECLDTFIACVCMCTVYLLTCRRMNAHRDPPATYPFVAITAANAHEEQPFTGGELALLDGVVGVEIGPSDVLVMDGARYHAVAPLRALAGENFKTQPLRHSLVHFTKSLHMEDEVDKGGHDNSVESVGSLKRTRARTRADKENVSPPIDAVLTPTEATLLKVI